MPRLNSQFFFLLIKPNPTNLNVFLSKFNHTHNKIRTNQAPNNIKKHSLNYLEHENRRKNSLPQSYNELKTNLKL